MTRLTYVRISVAVGLAALLGGTAAGDAEQQHAPPPPIRLTRSVDDVTPPQGLQIATMEYSHGDPTDDEQLFLELMNRARLDPQGEADRVLVDYDSSQIRNSVDFWLDRRPNVEYTRRENHDAFDALPAAPPLAMSSLLTDAARGHTQVMQIQDLQEHTLTGEPPLGGRVDATLYEWSGLGESIFINAKSMLHAHGGFAIDWGQGQIDPGTGRPETGHRDSLMSPEFVECGIGVLDDDDSGTKAGPQLITIDFAVPRDTTTHFVTGVVYDDTNGNDFYDPGEGIPGVRIETDASDFYAISSTSGGYSVPVPSNAGDVVVFAGGQVGTPGEVIGSQQVQVNVDRVNVKVDFGPLPEPAMPALFPFAGATGVDFGDGATIVDTVIVGELSPDDATVGDVQVLVHVDHDDRSELTLTLISPAGTEVVLFAGAPGGEDLDGLFDTMLRPAEPLSALVGEAHEGMWSLRVEDAAGGVAGGRLISWRLFVRPGWIRPLHAPATPLAVKTLKVKDSTKPGKDKVILKADLDPGGNSLVPLQMGTLRLLDAATGVEFLAVDISDPSAEPVPDAPTVKGKLDFNRNGSSRTAVTLKVSGLDLPGPVPATTRVELALGGVIVAEDVIVTSGKSAGVAGRRFFVDAIKSKTKADARSTVVKGRFAADGALGTVEGVVELAVGDARFRFDASELVVKGTKLQYKSGVGLRKLVIDTLKGTFSAKVQSDHEVVVNQITPVALRLGEAFYGSTLVEPYAKGTKTLY